MNDRQSTVIRPDTQIIDVSYIKEILNFKDLYIILSLRDIRIRYKQTLLGIGWVIFQPLITTAIFTLLFGKFTPLSHEKLPYPVFVYIGLVYWTYFSNALTVTSGSLIVNESIIKKVYFPKIIVPIASLSGIILDFCVSSTLLILMLVIYKVPTTWVFWVNYVVGFLLLTVFITGVGLLLCALNVKYRDVRFIVPFFIQTFIFLTPVFYSLNIVSPSNRWILSLNPMSLIIESARDTLSKGVFMAQGSWVITIIVTAISLIAGFVYFRRAEKHIADIL